MSVHLELDFLLISKMSSVMQSIIINGTVYVFVCISIFLQNQPIIMVTTWCKSLDFDAQGF